MAFLTGALAFWVPTFLSRAQVSQATQQSSTEELFNRSNSLIFGGVTVASGILGVCLGTGLSRWFRNKVPYADPLICAVGMLGSTPCLFVVIFVASSSIPVTYVFVFLAELLLSLNWSLLADMLLYVVVPTRRSTAEALQITVCHLLGDAGSPYLIGAVSDAIRNSKPETHEWNFLSLKYSFLICPFIGVLGGVFFLMTALYITEDRRAAERLVEEDSPPQPGPAFEPAVELSNEKKE